MPEACPFVTIIVGTAITIIIAIWLSASSRMQVKVPINTKYVEPAYGIFKNIRLRSSIEQFPISYEIISDGNLNNYIDTLLEQYEDSSQAVRNYIKRIPFTEQGQQFIRSISVGWHNSFSITLITHKKFDGYHKIMIAKLSKEVTISIFYKILSPISSFFGMTSNEQQQLEKIMTNLDQEENKQIMENVMMFIMADNLRNRFNNVLKISYVEK